MLKIVLTCGLCGLAAIGIGAINIWLGIAAMPVLYSLANAILTED